MQKRPFFFHHTLGFRRNPFGALARDEWTAVSILPATLQKLLAVRCPHVQLLGAMGSGKTTTLLKLADELAQTDEQLAYEYLAEGKRRYETDTAVLTTFFLDEAQRLTRGERLRLVRAAARQNETGLRLIFSSHVDLTNLFQRWQRPLTSINLEETLTVDLYGQMLTRRLDFFALPGNPFTMLSTDAIQWLYDQFYPNMRDAEYFLYEVWQRETTVREVTAVHLKKQFNEIG